MSSAKDETPAPVPENDPPPAATPPVPPPSQEPEAVAKQEGEKVPAWGQALNDKVDGISDMLSGIVPDAPGQPDDSPARRPWHKSNPLTTRKD